MYGEQLQLDDGYPTQLTIDYAESGKTISPISTEEELGKFILDAWREAQV